MNEFAELKRAREKKSCIHIEKEGGREGGRNAVLPMTTFQSIL